MDYFSRICEGEEGKVMLTIVMKDEVIGNNMARMAESKGVRGSNSLFGELVEEIKLRGHGWSADAVVTFKSYGKPAIVALRQRVMGELKGRRLEEVAVHRGHHISRIEREE